MSSNLFNRLPRFDDEVPLATTSGSSSLAGTIKRFEPADTLPDFGGAAGGLDSLDLPAEPMMALDDLPALDETPPALDAPLMDMEAFDQPDGLAELEPPAMVPPSLPDEDDRAEPVAPGLAELESAPLDLAEFPEPDLEPPAELSPVLPPVDEAPLPLPDNGADQDTSLEALIEGLSDGLIRFEREAHEKAVELAQSLASSLFPELSNLFLAEEIARHLPKLVPASSTSIEIRTVPGLADRVREMVDKQDGLAWRCTVVPSEAEGSGKVSICWGEGGVTFDFDGLLEACLARMNSDQSKAEG